MKQLRGTPLKRFLREFRRAHPITRDIALVLQSVAYPVNVGSLFRVADAAGVSQMFLCGITPTPPNATITKVGRDKHTVVNWCYEAHAEDALTALRSQGYHVVALEITDYSQPYFEAMFLGCPVIASDCFTGPREILGDNEYGLLVRVDSVDELARSIENFLMDGTRLKHYGMKAKKRSLHFALDKIEPRYISVLKIVSCLH